MEMLCDLPVADCLVQIPVLQDGDHCIEITAETGQICSAHVEGIVTEDLRRCKPEYFIIQFFAGAYLCHIEISG
jgi:hypothetical protein